GENDGRPERGKRLGKALTIRFPANCMETEKFQLTRDQFPVPLRILQQEDSHIGHLGNLKHTRLSGKPAINAFCQNPSVAGLPPSLHTSISAGHKVQESFERGTISSRQPLYRG